MFQQAGPRFVVPEFSLMQCLLLEGGVLAVGLVAARWRLWQSWTAGWEHWFARLSERPALAMCLIAGLALAIRLLLLLIVPVPMPLFHDEFSFLLGADTFFHGRLTNPQPPVAVAFETIHENLWPTYQSMYMPGTALLLTLGKLVGCPWVAVLFTTAIFCAALYWMAAAWLPRPYALVAGLLGVAIAENLNWWFDNYFAIALSGLGAALVLGSLPRIARLQTWQSTLPLTSGLLFLMLTRPYEGVCVSLPCIAGLIWKLRHTERRTLASLAAVPIAALSVISIWLLYYNWRGTGHPLLFPYVLNFRDYHITGPFLFSAIHPLPIYRLDTLRRFYTFAELPQYDFMRMHPWEFFGRKVLIYYFTFLFGFGLLSMQGLIYLLRRLREELLILPVLSFAGFAFNVVLMAWAPFPQYAAPAAPVMILLVAFGFYALRKGMGPRLPGITFVRGVILGELMLGLSVFGLRVSESRDYQEPQYVTKDRARVAREVLGHSGRQLCLVRYTPGHEAWQEWVFNGADPERERLVWARSLDPETDRKVIAAFPGRGVWLVRPDFADDLVSPYPLSNPRPIVADSGRASD